MRPNQKPPVSLSYSILFVYCPRPFPTLRLFSICSVPVVPRLSHLDLTGPGWDSLYPVQKYIYAPARVDGGRFSAQRHHFAQDADGLVGEGVEVLGVDARGGFGSHGWQVGTEIDTEIQRDRNFRMLLR